MANVTYVASGAVGDYNAVINKPAGLVAATPYFFVAIVPWFYNFDPAPTLSGGWTLIGSISDTQAAGFRSNIVAFYRVVTDASAEPSTYTFSASAGADWRGQILAFSNVDTSAPISAYSIATNAGHNGVQLVLTGPSIGRDGSLGLVGLSAWDPSQWSAVTGWTQYGGAGGEETGSYVNNSVQNTGTAANFSTTTVSDRTDGIYIILQPSAGGGGGSSSVVAWITA